MDRSVSSSVSLRVQRPTVPAFTQFTISSKCLHAYSWVCLMEHSYLVPVHCHMGIIFHYQPWGLELSWLTWGSSLWRTLALLLPSCSMRENITIKELPHIFFFSTSWLDIFKVCTWTTKITKLCQDCWTENHWGVCSTGSPVSVLTMSCQTLKLWIPFSE